MHQATAALRKDEGDFGGAYREYRLASSRKPSDAALRDEALQVWTRILAPRRHRPPRKRTRLATRTADHFDRYLYFADRYKAAKNLDEALKSVLDAEAFLQKSLPPRHGRARDPEGPVQEGRHSGCAGANLRGTGHAG